MEVYPMADCSMELEEKTTKNRKEVATFLPPNHHQVPENVSDVQPSFTNLYRADVVSLGLHRINTERGNRYKVTCLRSFLQWFSQKHKPDSIDRKHSTLNSKLGGMWDQFVEGLELDEDVQNASRRYGIDIIDGRLFKVKAYLALDALFLVMLLRYYYGNKCPKSKLPEDIYKELHDEAFDRLQAEAPRGIWRDVFLLDNQIPLPMLCKMWTSMPDMDLLFRKEALEVFNNLLREVMKDRYLNFFRTSSTGAADGQAYVTKMLLNKNFLEGHHLLDCLHYVVCCSSPSDHQNSDFDVTIDEEEAGSSPVDIIPSAVQLRKAGIRLKSKGCYFIHQIKFKRGLLAAPALILPSLRISDQGDSLSLFRNLAVFESREQGKGRIGPRMLNVSPYLKLMTKLVQSKKDIKQMKKDHVIVVGSGSNYDVYQMWNIMGKRLSCYHNKAWSKMLWKLTNCYESDENRMLAGIKKWWLSVSGILGAILLLSSGLQTAFTIAGYYKSSG